MTYHGPDQGSASDWSLHRGKLASTNQKNYPDLGSECRQSGIFAVVRLFIRRNFAAVFSAVFSSQCCNKRKGNVCLFSTST